MVVTCFSCVLRRYFPFAWFLETLRVLKGTRNMVHVELDTRVGVKRLNKQNANYEPYKEGLIT